MTFSRINKTILPTDPEEGDETEDDSSSCVKVIGTDVYFYGDIDDENIFELNTTLNKLEKKLFKRAIDLPGWEPTINLHIKSDGGDVYAGLSAMDTIENSWLWINTIAEGCVASAATFLLLAGHRRYMGKNAYVLIHQLSNEMWGKYEELKDEMKTCDGLMKDLKKMYKQKTSIPKDKLKTIMKRDVYLTSQECLQYDIVDEIGLPYW